MVFNEKDFLDRQKYQLLVAASEAISKDGQQWTPYRLASCVVTLTIGQRTVPSLAHYQDYPNYGHCWVNRFTLPYQDRSVFPSSSLQENLSDLLGLAARGWCCPGWQPLYVTKEWQTLPTTKASRSPWMTPSRLSHGGQASVILNDTEALWIILPSPVYRCQMSVVVLMVSCGFISVAAASRPQPAPPSKAAATQSSISYMKTRPCFFESY